MAGGGRTPKTGVISAPIIKHLLDGGPKGLAGMCCASR